MQSRREYVEKASGGRIGYIHLPNTAQEGNRELFKSFYPQVDKDAIIIDERFNGGGQGTGWLRTPESHALSILKRIETRLAQGQVELVRVLTQKEINRPNGIAVAPGQQNSSIKPPCGCARIDSTKVCRLHHSDVVYISRSGMRQG